VDRPSSRRLRVTAGVASAGVVAGFSFFAAAPAVAATDADCTSANTVDATVGTAADIQTLLAASTPLICLTGVFVDTPTLLITAPVTLHGTAGSATLDGAVSGSILVVLADIDITVENLRLTGARSNGAGGAIDSPGDVTIVNSLVDDNVAYAGGALYVDGGVQIIGSTFRDNRSDAFGGAIMAYGASTIESSTFEDNTSGGGAGAAEIPATLAVRNSTFVGNAGTGGALNFFSGSVTNSTFLDNSYAMNSIASAPTLIGNIFASSGTQVRQLRSNSAVMTDDGGNLFTSTTAQENHLPAPSAASRFGLLASDIFATGALADNGGPTQTIALNPDGPAIGAVPAGGTTTDQRGAPREGRVDAGAFQYVPPVTPAAAPALAATGSEPGVLGILAAALLAAGGLALGVLRLQPRRTTTRS
jgi:hypothetical protein